MWAIWCKEYSNSGYVTVQYSDCSNNRTCTLWIPWCMETAICIIKVFLSKLYEGRNGKVKLILYSGSVNEVCKGKIH